MGPTQCWKRGTVVECLPTTCDALSSIPSTGHTQKSTVTSSLRSKVVVRPLWQLRWSPYDLNGFHRELFKGESWLSLGVDTKVPFSCCTEPETDESPAWDQDDSSPWAVQPQTLLQEKTGTHSCFSCVAASTHCKTLQKAFNQVVWLARPGTKNPSHVYTTFWHRETM